MSHSSLSWAEMSLGKLNATLRRRAKIWLTDWRQVQLLDHHYLEALKLYLSKSPALETAPDLSLSYIAVQQKLPQNGLYMTMRTYFASGVNQI